MKLKYYLRGLGIGILVAAFIMGVATGGKEAMTDEEIRARAAELGMVDSKSVVLSDLRQEETAEPEKTSDEDSIRQEASSTEPSIEASGDPNMESEEASSQEQENEKPAQETNEADSTTESIVEETKEADEEPHIEESHSTPQDSITIVIERGDSSVSVSKALAAAGLVADAKEYDRYLCSNGYDKKLRIGTYEIAEGSSDEEIAKIITGR